MTGRRRRPRAPSRASASAWPTRAPTASPAIRTPARPGRCFSVPKRASSGIEGTLKSARHETAISPISEIIDEEDRENEGDLLIAAEYATAEAINFMARHGRGLICLTLTEERCRQLNLPLMVSNNRSPLGTNFTVSIEAAEGVTTGISAADRAR